MFVFVGCTQFTRNIHLKKSGWENEQEEDGKEEEEEKKPPMILNAMIFTCIDGYRWFDWSDWLHHQPYIQHEWFCISCLYDDDDDGGDSRTIES